MNRAAIRIPYAFAKSNGVVVTSWDSDVAEVAVREDRRNVGKCHGQDRESERGGGRGQARDFMGAAGEDSRRRFPDAFWRKWRRLGRRVRRGA